MTSVIETAHAKLNLTLEVLGRRTDGMHELASIVAFAECGDWLQHIGGQAHAMGRNEQPAVRSSVRAHGPFATAIVGENLVERALRAVELAAGCPLGVTIDLEKLLPVASGVGGGSADAAAALRLIRDANFDASDRKALAAVDWHAIARSLGADVPVCLASRSAIMTGTGELLRPVTLPRLDIVLANACDAVPADKTRRVFQALVAGPVARTSRLGATDRIERAELIAAMSRIGNDLEGPATEVMPVIARVKQAVAETAGCEIAILSGAGPTVVGVYASAEAAQAAARALASAHRQWWVRPSATLTT